MYVCGIGDQVLQDIVDHCSIVGTGNEGGFVTFEGIIALLTQEMKLQSVDSTNRSSIVQNEL